MKYVAIGVVAFFLIWGTVLVAVTKNKRDDSVAIKRYVTSRGAAPIPKTWTRKIGEGI